MRLAFLKHPTNLFGIFKNFSKKLFTLYWIEKVTNYFGTIFQGKELKNKKYRKILKYKINTVEEKEIKKK